MKIGIVTFHFVNNFGGALQAYGLLQAINEMNKDEVKVVDYRHGFIRFTDFVRIFPITTDIKEIWSGINTFKQRLGRINKFHQFMNEYLNLSEKYNSINKLEKLPLKIDKFVCGSDQIWNPIITLGVSYPYYLGFVKDKNNKISYAASFGVDDINNKYYYKVLKYLKEFKSISVREKKAVDLVKKITGENAQYHIDPTFLVSKEKWLDIAIKPKIEGKYILIYTMQKNNKVYEYARKIKEILGYKVVDINKYGLKQDFVDEVIIDVGPREFIGLFEQSAFICTNSFHGLAFSLILEKDFFVVPSTRFNSRIGNLMGIFELELYSDVSTDIIEKQFYDRERIKKIIVKQKEKSIKYLKENLFN